MSTKKNQALHFPLHFKKLEIDDKSLVEKYLSKYDRIHSDASFADLFCGRDRYKYEWCICCDFFIMRFISDDDKQVYLQPIGEGDIAAIIKVLEKDFELRGLPLILSGLTPKFVSYMKTSLPGWEFAADRRFSDYIYLADDLKYLKGRKYHSRRRLIKQFSSRYEFRYEELKPSMFADCMELENMWLGRKLAAENCSQSSRLEKDLRDEQLYIKNAFRYYDELSFFGGAIYADDRLIAFTFGTAITDEVFCICIEKADTDYIGVSAEIQNQFVSHLPENFKYVNAQWDCGIPGLRLIKEIYHPVFMVEEVIGRKLPPVKLRT